MKKYIGTKQIEAEPMTLGEACESKGLVKSEIEKNESYKLGYHTRTEYGYESWSPKNCLKNHIEKCKEETPICFGDAIDVLKQGGVIRRKGWNGKGLMVFKQVPAHISDVIPKMQSLPQSAKDLILKGKGFIDYTSQCLIYNENTGRADSWVPSISVSKIGRLEMIVTTDIGNILYRDCKAFGIRHSTQRGNADG